MHLFSLRRLLSAASIGVAAYTHGATLRVPTQYTNIQAAITAAVSKDIVLVAPGTYKETINFIGKAITVVSEAGPNETIVDANQTEAAASFLSHEMRSSVLSGFTLRNGRSSYGSGVALLGASPTLVSNIFENNAIVAGYYGAAIGGNSASPVIEQNIFRYNSSDDQFLAGIVSFVNGSSPRIANNVFHDNAGRAISLVLP